MSNLKNRVDGLLVSLAIGELYALPNDTNSKVIYQSGSGVIEFAMDASGEVTLVGGSAYGAIIPAELSLYVSGLVSEDQQAKFLIDTLGPKRRYPTKFSDVIVYLKTYAEIDKLLDAIGRLSKEEAMGRLRDYRRSRGEAW